MSGALDLRRGPQGRALVASVKEISLRVTRGRLGIPLPSMPGPKTLCGVSAGTLGFLSSADMDLGCTSGVSPGESVLVSSGGMHVHVPLEL